ncbi:hypothetical protein Ancab_030169 [Ancistrocladus abbreviatus]
MNHPRGVFTPLISRKRKERDEPSFLHSNRGNNNAAARNKEQPTSAPNTTSSKPVEPISSNRLLAGYMAYEFLTKGTLLGQKFDPARAEAVPVSVPEQKKKLIQGVNNSGNTSSSSNSGNSESGSGVGACTGTEPSEKKSPAAAAAKPAPQRQSYAEVANLLKTDGAHIPGIVNPTQLARWIRIVAVLLSVINGGEDGNGNGNGIMHACDADG